MLAGVSTKKNVPAKDSFVPADKPLRCKVLPVALAGAIYPALCLCNRFKDSAGQVSMDTLEYSRVLNPLRVFQGLTPKQEAYAQARFNGAGPTEAYLASFDASGSKPETVKRMAYDVDRNPNVAARVAQLMAERMKQSSLLPFLSPEFVTDGIMRIAMFGEKESNRLKAYEDLGKVAGIDLFRETTRVERVDRTAEDVDKELKAKLQAMMAAMTIDGTASSVPPSSQAPAAKPQPAGKVDRRRKPVAR
jgi:hypothetical protein